ncbi:CDP-alcohol phosphatidyltransferase family protein [sulfur-oxidizing endosymbiont of Gigantopelta aegis]|uniref:CDP-alcohol phosphatidyltransferase family protein n=1 Tax=sulfur-oxidizing endosymbiont of Gigantopelta aegis TaxID=2794934 RepID=UPI0018DC04B5|nr:CDP-alcohol phosphatidyltransferase family protein [sulfur-oxidizing endosymbiont of Gigantopelta aegis]
MTLYDIKPQFQSLLRPLVKQMASFGITANQVTLIATIGSVLLGLTISLYSHITQLFLLIPLWMFIRMGLNAIDGMLAREFNQQSKLGAILNEVSDVISDAALYIPFALTAPFSFSGIALIIFLATLVEFVGVLGLTIGGSRRYDGPMGKSDRALTFGALGLWFGLMGVFPAWLFWLMPLLTVLLVMTLINRTQKALLESNTQL